MSRWREVGTYPPPYKGANRGAAKRLKELKRKEAQERQQKGNQ